MKSKLDMYMLCRCRLCSPAILQAPLLLPHKCVPRRIPSVQNESRCSRYSFHSAVQFPGLDPVQAVQGFPSYDLNCAAHADDDDGLHDSGPSSHDIAPAPGDEARGAAFAMPINAAKQLSAQGAAKVLYTIARSDADAPGTASDSVALATSHPHYALSPLSGASHGNDDEADDAMHTGHAVHLENDMLRGPCSPGAATGMPVMDCAVGHAQPANGVPMEAMGSSMPMIFPWGDRHGHGGMQLVMTPQGFFPMNGRQQFLVPVQTVKGPSGEDLTVVMPPECCMHGGYGMVVAQDAPAVGSPVVFSTDGMSPYMTEGQPMCMPVLHLPDGHTMCNMQAAQAIGEAGHCPGGCVSSQHYVYCTWQLVRFSSVACKPCGCLSAACMDAAGPSVFPCEHACPPVDNAVEKRSGFAVGCGMPGSEHVGAEGGCTVQDLRGRFHACNPCCIGYRSVCHIIATARTPPFCTVL
jgi:hypothetical protein